MMMEALSEDNINMKVLETSGNHLSHKLITVLIELSLTLGGLAQIIYDTLHKVRSIL